MNRHAMTCQVVMLALATPEGRAQADSPAPLERVYVAGERASLDAARDIRRERQEIVDAVVASDIQKLPDLSVTEALQRVSGVQIARDRGEGAGITVRGLSQVETTLNGREVFTAGTGRWLDFADVPAELVAALEVIKTASAEQLEGGIGGTIDLRTWRPFDLPERTTAFGARWLHGDLVDRGAGQVSALVSRRWHLGDGQRVGALISLSHQRRAWREDQKSTGNPTTRSDLLAGQTVVVPNGTSETQSAGHRDRTGVSFALQWQPAPALDLYAEGSHARFETIQDSHQVNVLPPLPAADGTPVFVDGSVALFPGTQDVRRITWMNAPVSVLSFARDTEDRSSQAAVGGRWRGDALTLKADLSRTIGSNRLFFSGPSYGATASRFTQDLGGEVPSTQITGTSLQDPAALRNAGLAYRVRPFAGSLNAARLDGELELAPSGLQSLQAGLRYARRRADNTPGLIFGDLGLSGPATHLVPSPYDDFLPGSGATHLPPTLVGDLSGARDARGLRDAFGVDTPLPTAGNPLGVWQIDERSLAGYLMGRFAADTWPLDGNVGVRVVRTGLEVGGWQSVPGDTPIATIVPVTTSSRRTDVLPSLNLRWRLGDGQQLRLAASKTITRPNFDQLSPSLTLVPNTIDPRLNQGSAGNPDLAPLRSTNLDLAWEAYGERGQWVHVTVFQKQVEGFIHTVRQDEIHYGQTYTVSRPQNSLPGRVRGAELGALHFVAPGVLPIDGLGVQATYTYVDSRTTNPVSGADEPLQGLSRHSLNLVGMVEHGAVSGRLAWNWRSDFLSGTTNVVGLGALSIRTRSYGWLDGSLRWRVDPRLTLALEGTNLLRTLRTADYGSDTRPQSAWMNDRQIGVSAALKF